jgi:hypothetical protein
MAIFTPTITVNSTPALSVQVADSGVPPVTYAQVKQSLGSQVYQVTDLYLYSENINQLIGVIQYNRFDADGRQSFSSVATTIDPYAGNTVAITKDLTKYEDTFVLNGNSSFSSTILPNTYLQAKFWAFRLTNAFGLEYKNFEQIEKDSYKPNFYDNLGYSVSELAEAGQEDANKIAFVSIAPNKPDFKPWIWLGAAALVTALYIRSRD